MKKEASLYTLLHGKSIRCDTCQRKCLIEEGRRGWCRTRVNDGGKLFSLIYGEVSSMSVNPIEKKPVFHYYPGSRWLSLGSVGCNFRCPGCQNWQIAHWLEGAMNTEYLSPEDAVSQAVNAGCLGISWTFNEPALWFEYTLDTAKIAKARGVHTNYVTNGSLSEEALDMIAPYLDVYRVDIKGFSARTYSRIAHLPSLQGILAVTEKAKRRGMHVEVVTNIIQGYNDGEHELRGIAAWIHASLGPETPWHVTRFHPHHELGHVQPTPVPTLERAWSFGKEAGLRYVYLGNVPGHRWENTYCHACGDLLIERYVFDIVRNAIKNGTCPKCGAAIPGKFGKP
ncbi:MAG TPA: AmmeMemoRadiSam system radical SAM enzyme [Nitrospirota bacterium]|nr:AmmeMemoRadiSam system radical SAM enzyme [Nitrospirota bacterium]